MMNINSIGIYTDKGVVQGSISHAANGRIAESEQGNHPDYQNQGKSNQKTRSRDMQHQFAKSNFAKSHQNAKQGKSINKTLSKAESSRITDLFGRFDMDDLSQVSQGSESENRPGRIINIVV
ncbi:MAG: hypothetical protein J7K40_05685 [candidate division Zixibacteria bacterium]|nr:hypothetical protein [candidate division Zixibacteria bacterium]